MKHIIFLFAILFFAAGSTMQAQDRDRVKKQDRIHLEDHLMLKDGSCLLIKQGSETKLQEPLKLNNGTIIHPDGSYQIKDRERLQLRDGECLDMNGNRYLNQNKFNRRIMMTNKQIEKAQINAANRNRPGNQAGTRRGSNRSNN